MKKIFCYFFSLIVTMRISFSVGMMAGELIKMRPSDKDEIMEAFKSDLRGLCASLIDYRYKLNNLKGYEYPLTLMYMCDVYKAIGDE